MRPRGRDEASSRPPTFTHTRNSGRPLAWILRTRSDRIPCPPPVRPFFRDLRPLASSFSRPDRGRPALGGGALAVVRDPGGGSRGARGLPAGPDPPGRGLPVPRARLLPGPRLRGPGVGVASRPAELGL